MIIDFRDHQQNEIGIFEFLRQVGMIHLRIAV